MRISASYPATDGSCPESIEIEYPDRGVHPERGGAEVTDQRVEVPAELAPWIDVAKIGYEIDGEQRAAIAGVNALSPQAWSWAQAEVARRATTMPAHLQGDAPCSDCGTPDNISWHVDSRTWNTAIPPETGSPVLCIRCFVVRADRQGVRGHWTLALGRRATYPDRVEDVQQRVDGLADEIRAEERERIAAQVRAWMYEEGEAEQ